MQVSLSIDAEKCIRCAKCVKVCPAWILTQEKTGAEIIPEGLENCILCGHCVAACPTSSVLHSAFPPEKVHAIDRSKLPTPEQVMLLCKSRRSNRAFSSKPVPEEFLKQIVEAAYRAPTASNKQELAFTMITDPAKLHAVSKFTIDTFSDIAKKLENPILRPLLKSIMPDVYKYLPSFHRLRREFENGNDLILRRATALLLIHAPAKIDFGVLDANLAYQNGSLMAESLGVSQFYTGFFYTALQRASSNDREAIKKLLRIEGKVHAGMALGIPQFTMSNYIDKKPMQADFIK